MLSPPPSPRMVPTSRVQISRPSGSTEKRKRLPRFAAATRSTHPTTGMCTQEGAAYRTRHRCINLCRRESGSPPQWDKLPPPKRRPCDTAGSPPDPRRAARELVALGRSGLLQQVRQLHSKVRAVVGIGQRELDKSFEVTRKIADIVTSLIRRKFHGQDAPPFL